VGLDFHSPLANVVYYCSQVPRVLKQFILDQASDNYLRVECGGTHWYEKPDLEWNTIVQSVVPPNPYDYRAPANWNVNNTDYALRF